MAKSFSVRQYINEDAIADILYSAGQGCSYWGNASALDYESNVKKLMRDPKAIVAIYDIEGSETDTPKRYSLSWGKIKKGLQVLAKKYPERWQDIITDNADMYTADVIVQCAIFGDIIYS